MYAPETQQAASSTIRSAKSEACSGSKRSPSTRQVARTHLFKFGLDFQDSRYVGTSESRPVEIRRLDGTLAERTVFGRHDSAGRDLAEIALFAQDRWRIGSRADGGVGPSHGSGRRHRARQLVAARRGVDRRAAGRTRDPPRRHGQVQAADAAQRRRLRSIRAAYGDAVRRRRPAARSPDHLVNVPAPDLRTPESVAGNVEWNQRFGRRVLFKANYLKRVGSHEYILEPDAVARRDPADRAPAPRAIGSSKLTGRYLGGERRDITVSYVRFTGIADLNNYDQFYGNLRNPIFAPNEHNLIPTDVPHRLIVRGTIGLPGQWDFAPVIEIRSGFPWSAVDEFQDFVGAAQPQRTPLER